MEKGETKEYFQQQTFKGGKQCEGNAERRKEGLQREGPKDPPSQPHAACNVGVLFRP